MVLKSPPSHQPSKKRNPILFIKKGDCFVFDSLVTILLSAFVLRLLKMFEEFFFFSNFSAETGLMWLLKMIVITACG